MRLETVWKEMNGKNILHQPGECPTDVRGRNIRISVSQLVRSVAFDVAFSACFLAGKVTLKCLTNLTFLVYEKPEVDYTYSKKFK